MVEVSCSDLILLGSSRNEYSELDVIVKLRPQDHLVFTYSIRVI